MYAAHIYIYISTYVYIYAVLVTAHIDCLRLEF